MSDQVQTEGKEATPEVVTIPKETKQHWLQARIDYETGAFRNMRELSEKYGLEYDTLRQRVVREEWKQFDVTVTGKASQLIEEKVLSKVEKFFERLEAKGERYEKMVLASQSQAAQTQDSIPVLDPEQIDVYSKVESRILDWQKLALGINDKVQVQGTVDINVISILHKIKESKMVEKTIDVEAEVSELKEMVKLLAE